MHRIVKAGLYFYEVTCWFENETPVLESIHALTELMVFDEAKPIIFESSDRIRLVDAEKFTVDRSGHYPLATVLVELLKNPKSDPLLQAVS